MASYRVREGSITAAASFTNLGSLYGQSTTTSVQVPAGASAIVGMIVSVSHDSATNPPFKCDVAIPVTASNQISIAGAMDTDIGTAQMSVCLIFA